MAAPPFGSRGQSNADLKNLTSLRLPRNMNILCPTPFLEHFHRPQTCKGILVTIPADRFLKIGIQMQFPRTAGILVGKIINELPYFFHCINYKCERRTGAAHCNVMIIICTPMERYSKFSFFGLITITINLICLRMNDENVRKELEQLVPVRQFCCIKLYS